MPLEFSADHVAATDEEWGRLVAFGRVEMMEDSPYLIFQDAYSYTEQDVTLGLNLPYVEMRDQAWSWYGHIERVELRRSSITVQMDGEASKQMNNDGAVKVDFTLDDDAFAQLTLRLMRILGTLCVLVS